MNDNLIIIDAGHGGIDSGAIGNNLQEKDLNLKASQYLYNRLTELGIPTIMTRKDDEYLPREKRVNRIKEIVRNNPNKNIILISNHMNAGNGEGAEVVYSLKNNSTLADLILSNIGKKGQIERKVYQRRLPENPNLDYYYILRETNTNEPLLVEYGFIDNKNDSMKLKNNLLDYVEGVVESIASYLGYNYNNLIEEYIVQKGDTLYSISRKYNIPIEELKRINQLEGNNLSIGQTIKLKESNMEDTYTVQKGDTLFAIARKYNTTTDYLKELNNLTTNTLSIGQILKVPNTSEEIIEEEEYDIYTVEKNDSLWKISRKYDIPVNQLIEINNLKDLTLQIGQKLLVPKQEEKIYIVENGDTLWSIAKKNNISVQELKELNNLENNLLSVGQQLLL